MEEDLSSIAGSLLKFTGETGVDMPVDDSFRGVTRVENVVRKRVSKWDLVSESSVQDETEKDKSNAAIMGNAHWSKESKSGWDIPTTVGTPAMGMGEWKNDNAERDGGDTSWCEDQSYATRMSPGLDAWRHGQGSHSPRSGWASSQSRSRSRSPSRSFRLDVDDRQERGRRETQGSVPVCISYSKGHCRRGSECRYLHENGDRDSCKRSIKNSVPTDNNGNRQERGRYTGHFDDETHASPHEKPLQGKFPQDGNLRKRDAERDKRSTFCRDFRAGKCFRESGCRYIHDDGVRSTGSDGLPDKGTALERKHNGSKEEQEIQGRWQERKHEAEQQEDRELPPCRFFARGSCQKGSSCRYSHHVSINETSGKRSRDEGRSRRLDDCHRSRGDSYSEWGVKSEGDTQVSGWDQNSSAEGIGDAKGIIKLDDSDSHKGTNREPYYHPKGREHNRHYEVDSKWGSKEDIKYQILPKEASEAPLVTNHQCLNEVPYGLTDTVPSEAGVLQSNASTISFPQQHSNTTLLCTSSSDTHADGITLWNQVPVSASNAPAVCWPGKGVPLPSQAPMGAPMQVPLAQEESAPKFDTPKADNATDVPPTNNILPALFQTNPSMINSQNPSANDHAVQISNISVSLAQIFETVQQIPQLYNSLNSVTSAALAPSQPFTYPNAMVPPAAAQSVQHNGDMSSQSKPYDPITDSMEPLQCSESGKPEALGDVPNLDRQQANNKLDEHSGIHESSQKDVQQTSALEQSQGVEGKEACKETHEQGKEKQTDTSMDAHGDSTNEERKSKEAKGMRMFKFALVEVVKEMLKPTWKEGRMSKEAHKTIVKKVVDKVTSTLQGPQIPNTQERIDQYLAFSKIKLTKLVQAYVEKYLKV